MAKNFVDKSEAPIIAMDFDGTISIGNSFPIPSDIRYLAKEVINFMINSGIKVVIYTSRDTAINQDTNKVYDDITPMIQFLTKHGVKYSSINKSIQFAPFPYNSRKIYAHMYVDDRGYGWVESKCAMIYVLHNVLTNIVGIGGDLADAICGSIARGENTALYEGAIAKYIEGNWNR